MNSTCKLASVAAVALGLTGLGLVGATAANAAGLKPVGVDDYYTVAQGQSLTIAAPGILANDLDAEGDPLHVGNSFGYIAADFVQVNLDGSFTFTPSPSFYGTASFAYYPSDGVFGAQTTVYITVTPTDPTAPVELIAADDQYSTQQDTALVVPAAAGLLANDSGPGYVYTANGPAVQAGQIAIGLDGSFTYTPPAGFVGTTAIGYRTSDGNTMSNDALVTITVTATPVILPPVAPTAVPDAYSMAQGGVLAVGAASGLLANDSFPAGSLVEIDDLSGEVVAQADGSFVYTPVAGFWGLKEFAYRMTDGTMQSTWASVAITVTPTIPALPPTDPPFDPIDPLDPVDPPIGPADPATPTQPPLPTDPPIGPIDPGTSTVTLPVEPAEHVDPAVPTTVTAVDDTVLPAQLPTLAYTGADSPRAWLLAPALGALALGGLGLWIARRRDQHSR